MDKSLTSIPESNGEKHASFGLGDVIINMSSDSRATTAINSAPTSPIKAPELSKKEKAAKIEADNIEIGKITTIPLQTYPSGYPLQAAFQSSESCFSIYRAFSYLHSRVILNLQDELRSLEDDLHSADEISNSSSSTKRCLGSREEDLEQGICGDETSSERTQLLETIREKLVNYDELLMKARDLNLLQKPSKRDYRSLRRWFWMEKPLCSQNEEKWIKRQEDLITLRCGREWAGFDGWIEECVRKMDCWLIRWLFTTPSLREKTDNPAITYYSPSRISTLVGLIITIIIFVLLVAPVVAMYHLTNIAGRNSTFDAVGVLVVFTLLFSAALSLLTKAKRHELFAASAAYCAVLVVFISNFEKGK